MKQSKTFEWNFNLDEAKGQGFVLVIGKNSDGTRGICYATLDPIKNVWVEGDGLFRPVSEFGFEVKAWVHDSDLAIDIS